MQKISIVTRCMMSGGAERVIQQLLVYFSGHQINTSLILIDNLPIHYVIPSDCDVTVIGMQSNNSIIDKAKRYLSVRKILRKISPDVVLSMPEDIGIYVILAMLGSGIPVIVSERNNPWVMPNKKITRFLRKILYPFASGIIFQTQQAASFFSERIQNKGVVLPNPLDLSRIPEPYNGARDKIIAGAGRLETQKNFPLLIDAFCEFYKLHNDFKLIIYGEGTLRDQLKNYTRCKLPNEAFDFPGRVLDLPERINKVSVFVLSSIFEGMPNVLIEAMAMGVPCIATDCPSGGPAQIIKNEENAFLVPSEDKDEMINKLNILIDNEEISRKFSKESLKIRTLLDANIVCRDWIDYIDKKITR